MTAIITGDIINSRAVKTKNWLPVLEEVLQKVALQKGSWEIFRGDSFQVEVAVEKVLHAAVYLKIMMKTIDLLNVRMGVGIGQKEYSSPSIKKSNGEAFVFSGEAFEQLKKNSFLLKTRSTNTDHQINIIFDLMMLMIDKWNANVCKTVLFALDYPDYTQVELAKKLNKNQSQISRELNKSGFDEVYNAITLCQQIINNDATIHA